MGHAGLRKEGEEVYIEYHQPLSFITGSLLFSNFLFQCTHMLSLALDQGISPAAESWPATATRDSELDLLFKID